MEKAKQTTQESKNEFSTATLTSEDVKTLGVLASDKRRSFGLGGNFKEMLSVANSNIVRLGNIRELSVDSTVVCKDGEQYILASGIKESITKFYEKNSLMLDTFSMTAKMMLDTKQPHMPIFNQSLNAYVKQVYKTSADVEIFDEMQNVFVETVMSLSKPIKY